MVPAGLCRFRVSVSGMMTNSMTCQQDPSLWGPSVMRFEFWGQDAAGMDRQNCISKNTLTQRLSLPHFLSPDGSRTVHVRPSQFGLTILEAEDGAAVPAADPVLTNQAAKAASARSQPVQTDHAGSVLALEHTHTQEKSTPAAVLHPWTTSRSVCRVAHHGLRRTEVTGPLQGSCGSVSGTCGLLVHLRLAVRMCDLHGADGADRDMQTADMSVHQAIRDLTHRGWQRRSCSRDLHRSAAGMETIRMVCPT